MWNLALAIFDICSLNVTMATSVEDRVKHMNVEEGSYLESFIKSKCRPSKKSPNVYIPLSVTTFDDEFWLKKVEVGRKDKSKREKVIMMVGATGSGKTTTINAMFNYIMGVEFEDHFRLQLIEEDEEDQTKSVTKCITAYTIHHQPGSKTDYTLTIIDTPGFGDTGGVTRDKEIMAQIKTFFSTEGFNGIDVLDAVGFVVQSHQSRLTPTQYYVFDSVLSVFGKDIEDNIFMFYTFATPGQPLVLKAVTAAKIPHSGHFMFNHGGLFSLDLDKAMMTWLLTPWNLSWTDFRNFFTQLNQVKSKSLQMTKEVLLERAVLEDALNNIQENIMLGVNELATLNKEKEVLKKYEQDMDSKRHIEYQVDEQYTELADVPDGFTSVNCMTCNVTCLKTRYPWKNSNLEDCWLFREVSGEAANKGCPKCPLECEWNSHKCEEKYYVIKTRKITKTLGQLQKSYEDVEGKKKTAQQIIKECQERIDQVGDETVKLVEKAKGCIEKLDEIALKPDPLSTNDYIDLMIEAEKAKAGEELAKRIQALKQLKKIQDMKKNVAMGFYDQISFDGELKGDEQKNPKDEEIPYQRSNMTHVVEVQRNQDGHFLGRLKKIFRKFKPPKKYQSKQ